MLSKLFPSRLDCRENRIREQAQRHLNGELSYHEACEASQSNGIIEWFCHTIHGSSPMSKSQIHKKFDAELMDAQLQNSVGNFDMLMYHVLNPELSYSDPSCYQRFFSNIEVGNSQFELKLSLTVINDYPNGLIMTLTKYDRQTNSVDNTFKPKNHYIPNYNIDQLSEVLIEHAIYQHKQHGIAIPDLVKDLPDKKNRIAIYLREAFAYQYDGICFSGGGAKGVLYPGALEGLREHRLCNVERVSGASAGAITASLVASGMKPYEFTKFMNKADLDITQKELIAVVKKTMLRTIRKRLNEFNLSLNSSDMPPQQIYWINKYNGHHPSLTFDDLHQLKIIFPSLGFKELFLTATHFSGNDPRSVELSVHTAPNMDVAKAVAASAALPWWFAKVDATSDLLPAIKDKLKVTDGKRIKLEDGGIVKNNPADLLSLTSDTRKLSVDLSSDQSLFGSFIGSNVGFRDEEFKDELTNVDHQNQKSVLCLGFIDSKDLHETSPSGFEIFSGYFVTPKMLGYQRFETFMLQNYFNIYYMPIYGIGVVDFKHATRRFPEITVRSRNNFTEWEFYNRGKMKFTNPPDKKQHVQNMRLKEAFGKFYGGTKIEKRVLNSKRKIIINDGSYIEMTLFKQLCEAHHNHNCDEFDRLYKQMHQEISMLKTKDNVFCW